MLVLLIVLPACIGLLNNGRMSVASVASTNE